MRTKDDRPPPARVRLTGLQEDQLADLLRLDAACAAMYYAVGFDAAEVPARREADFAALARSNSVHVAEADRVPAGVIAWHDEAPGVAYLTDISVDPAFQRFGIGAKLLDAVRNEARGLRLDQIVVRCWEKATWAMAFYRRQRFMPIDATAPALVKAWRDNYSSGRPLTRPGELALWSPIGPAPKATDDDEIDTTLLTGEAPTEDSGRN